MEQKTTKDELLTLINGHGSSADEPDKNMTEGEKSIDYEEIIIFDYRQSKLTRKEILNHLTGTKEKYLQYFQIFNLPLDLYFYQPFRFGKILVSPSTKNNIENFFLAKGIEGRNRELLLQFMGEIFGFQFYFLDNIDKGFLSSMESLLSELGMLSQMYNHHQAAKAEKVSVTIKIEKSKPYKFKHPWIIYNRFLKNLQSPDTLTFEEYITPGRKEIPYHKADFVTYFRNKIIVALHEFLINETDIKPMKGAMTTNEELYFISEFLPICRIPILDIRKVVLEPGVDDPKRWDIIRKTIISYQSRT